MLNRFATQDHRFGHGNDSILLGIGHIADGQFKRSNVLNKTGPFPFHKIHLRFDSGQGDVQFVKHHQTNSAVEQDNAGTLAKHNPAANQQGERSNGCLCQLPQNSQRGITGAAFGAQADDPREQPREQSRQENQHSAQKYLADPLISRLGERLLAECDESKAGRE